MSNVDFHFSPHTTALLYLNPRRLSSTLLSFRSLLYCLAVSRFYYLPCDVTCCHELMNMSGRCLIQLRYMRIFVSCFMYIRRDSLAVLQYNKNKWTGYPNIANVS